MSEEIIVKNYRRSRKFGWGWSTTPTGEDAYSIETPTAPDYEGTLSQLRQAMAADKAWRNLGGAFYNTAWFYDGRRITHTWQFGITKEPENADDLLINEYYDACEYGYVWSAGWSPDWDSKDVKIKIEQLPSPLGYRRPAAETREREVIMKTAIEVYAKGKPLLVQPHIVKRAVRALSEHKRIEALALIRGAYTNDEGAFASLDEAKEIFALIMASF